MKGMIQIAVESYTNKIKLFLEAIAKAMSYELFQQN